MTESKAVRILSEDAHLIVIEKPAGMLSQPGQGEAAACDDAVSYLIRREREKHRIPEGSDIRQREPYIGVVHRLDRGVGGVMVYAKKPETAAALSAAVSGGTADGQRAMTKQYLCVTNGIPAEMRGEYRDLLYKDAKQNKVFVVDRARTGTREARLTYEVLRTVRIDGEDYALLCVTLGTGRSHQIRAQLSHHGTPIVADGKYGGRRPPRPADLPDFAGCGVLSPGEIALYSHRLAFAHPGNVPKKNKRKKGKNCVSESNEPRFPDIDITAEPDKTVIPWVFFHN